MIIASGAGANSRFNIGLMIAAGVTVGTLFTLFAVPAFYLPFTKEQRSLSALNHAVPEAETEAASPGPV